MSEGLDESDRRALEFAAAHDRVTSAQIGRLLGEPNESCGKRIAGLIDRGAAAVAPRLRREAVAIRITPAGLDVIGSELPPPRALPDLRNWGRDLALAWLWVGARQGHFGSVESVLSRRAMRACDARRIESDIDLSQLPADLRAKVAGASFAMEAASGAARYPGLCLVLPHGRVAFERIVTMPSRRWLDRVLTGYVSKPSFARVPLLVPSDPVARVVIAEVDDHPLKDLVRVQIARLADDS